VVLPRAIIGSDCNICNNVFIENDVIVGNRVTVKSGVQLWDGIEIEDDVFIGPNVTFSNDHFPRSKKRPKKFVTTLVSEGASIGSNSTILPGLNIGKFSMVGAGSVVTKNVPDFAIVVGNPARIIGYVDVNNVQRVKEHPEELLEEKKLVYELAGSFVHELPKIEDLRGNLSVIEFQKNLPFEVKRCFWIYGVPSSEVRGEHAHIECHQFIVCIAGSIQLLLDNGNKREQLKLDRSTLGVHIPPKNWAIQYQYSKDAVLLVFASHHYDEKDYIRDYDSFLKIIK
jgi:acetyltransferase-like isoleucine patch superfamily enzyme